MLRTALLSLVLLVSLSSSASSLKKSISRRQSDPQYCQAIEGFECKCSYYRVTCTTDRNLPSQITVVENEKNKYQSVELAITAERDINVNDQTFEPVKELYKPDGDNLEFRVKFEKFTALNLSSPGIFNRVFPDNLPANARKHLSLEIYNPVVPPNESPSLFKNLNADSLELYVLYPLNGSFQQLFDGANIKYLRLSGGDIRSDVSQPFTGNIARLEIAKQAGALSVQNFPAYPAHELTINAFYITDFANEHPSNYKNLVELRVYSQESIPANAFRNFPNIRNLSISTDKDIDPQALNGLNKLEKLIIKDTKASVDLLNSVPSVKEFETNFEKLDEKTQCQLLEKLASGQVAIQAIPNARECTCVTAYLDTAAGRVPCDVQHCDHSSCATIKNNYNVRTGTFKTPPTVRRSDGSDAFQVREPRVYTAPFQVDHEDQEKLQEGTIYQSEEKYGGQKSDDDDDAGERQQPDESYNQKYTYNPLDDDSFWTSSEDDVAAVITTSPSPSDDESQRQDQDDNFDGIDLIIKDEDKENQSDVVCFNLSRRKYLGMILFGIDEEKDSMLHKNDPAEYFYEYRATGTGIKQTKAKYFLGKLIKERSGLSYDEIIELAVSTLVKVLSTDLIASQNEISVAEKENVTSRMLVENEIEDLTPIAEKE